MKLIPIACLLAIVLVLPGCFPGIAKKLSETNLKIRPLPPEIADPCKVPKIHRNAKIAALQQRNALWGCKDKHGKAVDAYGRVRKTYSGKN